MNKLLDFNGNIIVFPFDVSGLQKKIEDLVIVGRLSGCKVWFSQYRVVDDVSRYSLWISPDGIKESFVSFHVNRVGNENIISQSKIFINSPLCVREDRMLEELDIVKMEEKVDQMIECL